MKKKLEPKDLKGSAFRVGYDKGYESGKSELKEKILKWIETDLKCPDVPDPKNCERCSIKEDLEEFIKKIQ